MLNNVKLCPTPRSLACILEQCLPHEMVGTLSMENDLFLDLGNHAFLLVPVLTPRTGRKPCLTGVCWLRDWIGQIRDWFTLSAIVRCLPRMLGLLGREVRIHRLHDWSPKGVHLPFHRVPIPVQEVVRLQHTVRPARTQERSHLANGNAFKGCVSLRRPKAC